MVMRQIAGFLFTLVPFTSAAQPPPTASVEDPRAVEARRACAAGEVDKGIKQLADYLASTEDVIAIYNMARCYQQNGQVDKALLQFREYLRKAKDLTREDRQDVDGHIADLEAEQRRQAALAPTAGPTPPPDSFDSARRGLVLRRAGLVTGGAGVVALGVGLAFALKVRSANDDLAAERQKDAPQAARYRQVMADARSAQTLEWVFIGVGAAAVAAGATCYLLGNDRGEGEQRAALAPWLLPGGGGGSLRVGF
jgi:hypothetical protein